MRGRPLTELYLAAVRRAVDRPGCWVDVRVFATEMNASVTAGCLAGGYLRVEPRDADFAVEMRGKRYTSTAAAVETRIQQTSDGWLLRIRFAP